MTLHQETKNIFRQYNVVEKAQSIMEYVTQRKIRLEKLKEQYIKTKEYRFLFSINEELEFIYMLDMALIQFELELNRLSKNVLTHIEIEGIKKDRF